MRPAVIVLTPLLLLPLLACESDLAGPEPDAAVTELQQPPSADPLFGEGGGPVGCGSVIVIDCGQGDTENNGNGPNGSGQRAADASTADTDAVSESEGVPTKKKVRAQKKGRVSTDAVTESEGTPTKKKVQARVGRY